MSDNSEIVAREVLGYGATQVPDGLTLDEKKRFLDAWHRGFTAALFGVAALELDLDAVNLTEAAASLRKDEVENDELTEHMEVRYRRTVRKVLRRMREIDDVMEEAGL